MQVLQWAIDHPDELGTGMLVCASAQLSAQNIAFSAIGRAAIMRDENFADGDYYDTGKRPDVGLAIARMAAHITYVSEGSLEAKFGRARSARAHWTPTSRSNGISTTRAGSFSTGSTRTRTSTSRA